ncbi:MAG: hypothetical protein WCD57_13135 [Acidobacteriaceae bacterium]
MPIRRIMLNHLVLLCLAIAGSTALASGQTEPAAPVAPDRLPDSYLIYAMLMPGQLFEALGSGTSQAWAIARSTVNEDDIDPKLAPDATLQPPDDNPNGFKEAVNDYNQRKKERLDLTRRLSLSQPYVLLSPNDVRQFKASRSVNSTSELKSKYGDYVGITFFSEVYFNIAQTSALVYILDWCGHLCSQAEWIYLEKQDGVWVRRSGKAPAQT